MKTTHFDEPQDCPSGCGYKMDSTSSMFGDYEPKPGMLSICLGCNSLHMFGEGLKLRLLTSEEYLEVRADKRAWLQITQAQLARLAPGLPPLNTPKTNENN
jgi:hypothetical protein